MAALGLDPRTPVLIGVGQTAERLEDAGLSPIELAVQAARAAVADSQADSDAVLAAVDTIAATRQFENSSARAVAPLGKSTKFPLSVAHRLGAAPKRTVLDIVGGQSPQRLVSEFSHAIAAGLADVVLLVLVGTYFRSAPAWLRTAEDQALDSLPDNEIKTAMQALPEHLRSVVYYADVEGLRHQEIAALMNTPRGTVASQLSRSRRRLRRLLDGVDDAGTETIRATE